MMNISDPHHINRARMVIDNGKYLGDEVGHFQKSKGWAEARRGIL